MTKNVFRNGLVIGIIILFVGASIIPSIGSLSIKYQSSTETMTSFMDFNSRGNTLYVGGDGPGNYEAAVEEKDIFNLNECSDPLEISSPNFKIKDIPSTPSITTVFNDKNPLEN